MIFPQGICDKDTVHQLLKIFRFADDNCKQKSTLEQSSPTTLLACRIPPPRGAADGKHIDPHIPHAITDQTKLGSPFKKTIDTICSRGSFNSLVNHRARSAFGSAPNRRACASHISPLDVSVVHSLGGSETWLSDRVVAGFVGRLVTNCRVGRDDRRAGGLDCCGWRIDCCAGARCAV